MLQRLEAGALDIFATMLECVGLLKIGRYFAC
jgi:hypothetical protein